MHFSNSAHNNLNGLTIYIHNNNILCYLLKNNKYKHRNTYVMQSFLMLINFFCKKYIFTVK